MKEEKTKMEVGNKVRFRKEYERLPFALGLSITVFSGDEVFTIEAIDKENGGIVLKEDIEQPKRTMAPEWLEPVRE